MASADMRFGWIHQVARLLAVVLSAVGAGFIGLGAVVAIVGAFWQRPTDWQLLGAGCGMIIAGLLLLLVGLLVYGLFRLLLKLEAHTFRMRDVLMDLSESASRQRDLLGVVADNAQLSDAAKSITHRQKERDALRDAIYEEIIHQDWESAYNLIDDMERRYGYREEAERLRKEVDVSRDRTIEETVEAALARIDELAESQRWDQARGESQRLMQLFPNNERIQRLPEQLEQYRQEHKRRLLNEWNQAVQRKDIDRSIEVLKLLDQYLTPSEAAALEESARGVFRAKLQNLGVQFSLAVTDKRWIQAVEIGEEIVREFPNSLMAKEVTDSMPALMKRVASIRSSDSSGSS